MYHKRSNVINYLFEKKENLAQNIVTLDILCTCACCKDYNEILYY